MSLTCIAILGGVKSSIHLLISPRPPVWNLDFPQLFGSFLFDRDWDWFGKFRDDLTKHQNSRFRYMEPTSKLQNGGISPTSTWSKLLHSSYNPSKKTSKNQVFLELGPRVTYVTWLGWVEPLQKKKQHPAALHKHREQLSPQPPLGAVKMKPFDVTFCKRRPMIVFQGEEQWAAKYW